MSISDWSSDVCSSDLDQLRRVRQHGDRGGGDGGLAARIEPAQLVGVPAIRSLEGQGAADAELGAAVRARDREQQARVVAAWIVDRAAAREVLGSQVRVLLGGLWSGPGLPGPIAAGRPARMPPQGPSPPGESRPPT